MARNRKKLIPNNENVDLFFERYTPQEQFADLTFPVKGVDLSQSFSAQRSGTTPTGINVRGFEPGTLRARGGQRPGLARYIGSPVNPNGSWVQDLQAGIATAAGPGPTVSSPVVVARYSDPNRVYPDAAVLLGQGGWSFPLPGAQAPDSIAVVVTPGGAAKVIVCAVNHQTGFFSFIQGNPTTVPAIIVQGAYPGTNLITTNSISCTTDGVNFFLVAAVPSSPGTVSACAFLSAGPQIFGVGNTTPFNVYTDANTLTNCAVTATGLVAAYSRAGVVQMSTATGLPLSPYVLLSPTLISQAAPGYVCGLGLAAAGNTLAVSVLNPTTNQGGIVFVDMTTGNLNLPPLLNLAPCTAANNNLPPNLTGDGTNFYAVFASGGTATVFGILPNGTVSFATPLPVGQNGPIVYNPNTASVLLSGTISSWEIVPIGAAFAGSIFSGGPGTGLTALYADSHVVIPWGAGGGPDTVYNRQVFLTAVAGGNIYYASGGSWGLANGGGGALSSTARVIRSFVNNQKIYFLDGNNSAGNNWKLFDLNARQVLAWTASAGQLPVDTNGNAPRLGETWRGRAVLAGIIGDPQNWFMSRINDPTNWDYAPQSITPQQAIAGNNAPQGLVGDAITAIIPYSDDVLIFGADHTIWAMNGDPMAGGQIDRISDRIGIAWGTAWCRDPYGTLYFLSNLCGVYMMAPGAAPQRISQQVEQLLTQINLDDVVVRMVWDDKQQGFNLFVTSLSVPVPQNPPVTNLFWEQRTGAWWVDSWGDNTHLPPYAVLSFFGNTPADRVTLLGGQDGFVRAYSNAHPTDDGAAIASSVLFGPLLTADLDEIMLKDVQTLLGANSGPVSWAAFVGPTAEMALVNPPVASGTYPPGGGRQFLNYVRRTGYAVWVQLSATNPWAFESMRLRFGPQGKVRRRGAGTT